jgi:hypothetical protein
MSRQHVQKNIKLSLDFDSYVSKHPKVLNRVPSGAHIVFILTNDKKFSESNLDIARNSRSGRFVVAHKKGSDWKIESVPPKH